MAIACDVTFDKEKLKVEVRATCARVATEPNGDFHFHRGPEYAARQLGYDYTALQALPRSATASFAGVGNPFQMGALPSGATVIDLGCGAGMDCLLAAKQVGREGQVIGFDMTMRCWNARAKPPRSPVLCGVEFVEVMEQCGFRDAQVRGFFDSFFGTSKEKVARKFGVRSPSRAALGV